MRLRNACFLFLILCLTACAQGSVERASSTPSILAPRVTLVPTDTQVPPTEFPTKTKFSGYQLTYESDVHEGYNGVYAMDVGCLEEESLCLGEPRMLFEIPENGSDPHAPILAHKWSPDGKYVALCAAGADGQADIFVADLADLVWMNLTSTPTIYECDPAWTPDGRNLTYMASSDELYNGIRIFSTSPFGGEVSQLLEQGGIQSPSELSWSPDGKKVVFTSQDLQRNDQIFISDPDGSSLIQLTDYPGWQYAPSFSPDGEWIMFVREFGDIFNRDTRIVLIRRDAPEEEMVINFPDLKGFIVNPTWAPFGNWIAFSIQIENKYSLYLVHPDGSGLTNISTDSSNNLSPEWRFVGNP